MTLHYVALLRERALLNKARARYKSRHSDRKEEFASAKRLQMQKHPPRTRLCVDVFAFVTNAKHLQIQRSVIWAHRPNPKESRTRCAAFSMVTWRDETVP